MVNNNPLSVMCYKYLPPVCGLSLRVCMCVFGETELNFFIMLSYQIFPS